MGLIFWGPENLNTTFQILWGWLDYVFFFILGFWRHSHHIPIVIILFYFNMSAMKFCCLKLRNLKQWVARHNTSGPQFSHLQNEQCKLIYKMPLISVILSVCVCVCVCVNVGSDSRVWAIMRFYLLPNKCWMNHKW